MKGKIILAIPFIWFVMFFMMMGGMIVGGGSAASEENSRGRGLNVSNVPPEYYDDVVRAGSICNEISPALIAAQIEAESSWNKDVVSSAGARGISQFMPGTWIARGRDGDGDGNADIDNPHDQIYSQGVFMCDLIREIQSYVDAGTLPDEDRITLALAAYNAGMGNVLIWKGIPEFDETRNYVQRIKKRIPEFAVYESPGLPFSVATSKQIQEALEWAAYVANNSESRYVYGGEGPLAYDCSGLTQAFARKLNVELPHKADLQARMGELISDITQAQPGDLVFWSKDGGKVYYHAAIYAGNWTIISANSVEEGIVIEPIWGREQTMVFRRIVNIGQLHDAPLREPNEDGNGGSIFDNVP